VFARESFEPELLCAEENELLGRIASEGGVVHTPLLSVYHHRRQGLRRHARQLFKYGVGRGQVVARNPSPRQLAFLLPAAAAAGTLAALLLVPPVGLALCGLYALAVVVEALRIVALRDAPIALTLIVLTHACYAAGTVAGAAYELRRRRS
jgi:hypothetical protein